MSEPREPNQSDTTHFGFRTVDMGEKQGLVRGVFDSVADKYDLMNDLMSAGLHRVWKRRMLETLHMRPNAELRLVEEVSVLPSAGVYHGVPWDLQREGCDSVESLLAQASSAAQS